MSERVANESDGMYEVSSPFLTKSSSVRLYEKCILRESVEGGKRGGEGEGGRGGGEENDEEVENYLKRRI